MQAVLEKLKSAWLLASSFLLVVVYFLFQKEKRSLSDVRSQLQKQEIQNTLQKLLDKANDSKDAFVAARDSYQRLKLQHPEFFAGLPKSSEPVRQDAESSPPGPPGSSSR